MVFNQDALDAIEDVIEAINEYGYEGTLTEVVEGPYDPVLSKNTSVRTPYPVKYIKKNYTTAELQTGLYGVSDFKAIIYYNKTVEKNWLLYDAAVLNVIEKGLQGTTIVMELQCRK